MRMQECPQTGLVLPSNFIDEKQALKKTIDTWVDKAVKDHQYLKGTYFLTFHAKFDKHDPTSFTVDAPKITRKLPPFLSNTMVFWVNNERGICELLWIVPAKKAGQKLKVEFNQEGVAYLQAKGAMPS